MTNNTTKLFVSSRGVESLIARYLAEVKGLEYICLDIESHSATAATLALDSAPALSDRYVTLSCLDVIFEYLEEQHPAPCLLPINPADRAIYRSVVRTLHRNIFPLLEASLAGEIEAKVKLAEILKQFNDTLKGHTFFAGETFSLIDANLVPWLHCVVTNGVSLKSLPHLKAYAERIFASDAFRACLEEIAA